MKIILISYSFPPEVSARSNRTFELAKQFAREGNIVHIFIPANDYDYSDIEEKYNIKIIKIGNVNFLSINNKSNTNIKSNKILKKTKGIVRYFIGGEWHILNFVRDIYNLRENIDLDYDIGISIGLPFSTHIGYYLLSKKNRFSKVNIADYGDPYSYNKTIKKPYIYKLIEKKVANYFDYISIPIEEAKPCYKFIRCEEKIKIIPQGFEIREYKHLYKKNKVPTFAFAGNFYKDIRNPKNLFDTLSKINLDYKFILYVNLNDINQIEFIEYAKLKLNNKVLVKGFIEREDCIRELSKMDFLINISNLSSTQVPSKLIDYSISGRPILSIKPNDIDRERLNRFLNGVYDDNDSINLDRYNIKNISNEFISLACREDAMI